MKRTRTLVVTAWYGIVSIVTLASNALAVAPVSALESGGYPWANAIALNTKNYDWGFRDCLEPMRQANVCQQQNYTKNGVSYFQSDPWGYYVRNCTSYVAWRVHNEYALSIAGWGNAHNWNESASMRNFPVDTHPREGDIAVWEGGYGHVAFVTGVNPDGSVNVEQYNRAGTGEFSRESRVRAYHYIHLKPLKPKQVSSPPIVKEIVSKPAPVAPKAKPSPVVMPTPIHAPNPLPSTAETDFTVAVSPLRHQANVYAIHYDKTASGQVEVSKSRSEDGNSTWESVYTTTIVSHGSGEKAYSLADYNADGTLDLYAVKYAQSTSGFVEVTVVDGASNYTRNIGSWRTSERIQPTTKSNYVVADYNGDSQLDIYKIESQTSAKRQVVTVFDGSRSFGETLGEWESEDQVSDTGVFTVSDYDHDGKIDLFRVNHHPEQASLLSIQVFDARSSYKKSSYHWDAADK